MGNKQGKKEKEKKKEKREGGRRKKEKKKKLLNFNCNNIISVISKNLGNKLHCLSYNLCFFMALCVLKLKKLFFFFLKHKPIKFQNLRMPREKTHLDFFFFFFSKVYSN